MIKDNEYQCEACKGIFEKGWSDEEQAKEAATNFGKIDDPCVVCDDCYNVIIGNVSKLN